MKSKRKTEVRSPRGHWGDICKVNEEDCIAKEPRAGFYCLQAEEGE